MGTRVGTIPGVRRVSKLPLCTKSFSQGQSGSQNVAERRIVASCRGYGPAVTVSPGTAPAVPVSASDSSTINSDKPRFEAKSRFSIQNQ